MTTEAGFLRAIVADPADDASRLVYQGLFISEAEHEFLKRSGGPALEERLTAQATVAEEDVRCSLLRPSCV